jgi:hypothetical protein
VYTLPREIREIDLVDIVRVQVVAVCCARAVEERHSLLRPIDAAVPLHVSQRLQMFPDLRRDGLDSLARATPECAQAGREQEPDPKDLSNSD